MQKTVSPAIAFRREQVDAPVESIRPQAPHLRPDGPKQRELRLAPIVTGMPEWFQVWQPRKNLRPLEVLRVDQQMECLARAEGPNHLPKRWQAKGEIPQMIGFQNQNTGFRHKVTGWGNGVNLIGF